MLFGGTSYRYLASETLLVNCPHCNAENSVDLHFYQEYFHIFFLPFTGTGKTASSLCRECGARMELKEMPEGWKAAVKISKKKYRGPLWIYSGAALAVLAVGLLTYDDYRKRDSSEQFVLDPKPGDVYEVQLKEDEYTFYKVERVSGDTAFMLANDYMTNQQGGLSKIEDKWSDRYNTPAEAVLKERLKKMFDNRQIIYIHRK